MADLPWVNSLLLNNLCLTLCAFSVAAIEACDTFAAYAIVSVAFGIGLGKKSLNIFDENLKIKNLAGYMSLTSIILVDLLGLDNLTNAFGLLILFRGAAAIVGAPVISMVSEAIQFSPFLIAGLLFVFAAIFSFLAPFAARYKKS